MMFSIERVFQWEAEGYGAVGYLRHGVIVLIQTIFNKGGKRYYGKV